MFIVAKAFGTVKLGLSGSKQCYRYLTGRSSSIKAMKILNVAEKNDAAKNIAAYLSNGTCKRREGLSPYNKIFEFKLHLWNQDCDMIMTSVSGHLLNHTFVGTYQKWQSCHPLSLFEAPTVKECSAENSIKIKKTLEREVQRCSMLIIWTDCDREGENIGFEIIQVCRAFQPNIRIHRAKFSEITQMSIHRALQTLCEPDKAISDAVDVRSELDLRIGAAFTRFQTLRLRKVFPRTLADMLISYGSCQFPTLGFVVERFLAIERFKPEPYWKIKVTDVRDNVTVEFRWARGRLFEELPCEVFLDICLEQPNATVKKVTVKPKSKFRPLPLDTVELGKQGSRKLHLSAKETMRIAEKLYTQGLISYPRTETNIFPKELNLIPLVSGQADDPTWGNFAQRLLGKGLNPRVGKKTDHAHPPIHPTKYINSLRGDEAKVYEFVVRHFLACLSQDAIGQETTVEIEIAEEKFTANGLRITERNYLEVYKYEKWGDKEIHAYREGQTFSPTSIDMVQEETSAPQLLTEADLIGLMDKHGIGTDATHAEHIDTIKSRQYVGLVDGKHLMPGKLGIGLVMGYDNMGFQMSKPDLRADLEKDLKMICDRQKNPRDVLEAQIKKYRNLFKIAMEHATLIDNALAAYLDEQPNETQEMCINNQSQEVAILKCPKCRSNMVLRERKQGMGKFISCMGYPKCNNAIWFPQIVEGVEILHDVCSQCPQDIRKLKFTLTKNAFPIYGTTYVTCIGGCDPSFNELLNIKYESVKSQSQSQSESEGNYSSMFNESAVLSTLPARNSGTRPVSDTANETNLSRYSASVGLLRSQSINHDGRRNDSKNTVRTDADKFHDSTKEPKSSSSKENWAWGVIDEGDIILCKCEENAVRLTVRKEGPNKGRLFFKCAKGACNFFLWGTDQAQENADQNERTSLAENTTTHVKNFERVLTSSNNDVKCNCNQVAKQRIVQKDGPNKGRPFFACPKGPNAGCNFFQWSDENVGNRHNDDTFGRQGNQQREIPRRQPRIIARRKCGNCGIEGHTRRTCPENAMD